MEISSVNYANISFNSAVSEFDTIPPVERTTSEPIRPQPIPESTPGNTSTEVVETSPEYIVPEASRSTSSSVDTYA